MHVTSKTEAVIDGYLQRYKETPITIGGQTLKLSYNTYIKPFALYLSQVEPLISDTQIQNWFLPLTVVAKRLSQTSGVVRIIFSTVTDRNNTLSHPPPFISQHYTLSSKQPPRSFAPPPLSSTSTTPPPPPPPASPPV